jgi:hypothetical protein
LLVQHLAHALSHRRNHFFHQVARLDHLKMSFDTRYGCRRVVSASLRSGCLAERNDQANDKQ